MKRSLIEAGVLALILTGVRAGCETPDPGDLPQFFAGEWTLAGREGTFRERCEWLSPNSYLVCRGSDTDPTEPTSWITLLGYSHATETYNLSTFGGDGGGMRFAGWLHGDTWVFAGQRELGTETIRLQVTITPTQTSRNGAAWALTNEEDHVRLAEGSRPLAGTAVGAERKTFMVVVAHPDDENMMGEVLAKLARLGHRVQVVIATDGKDGTRVTRIPAGDELGRLRRRESECACARLGIEPPIFLSIERLDTKIGVRAYLEGRKRLLAALEGELTALHPDAVLTFGPDGEYGHSEHIVVGAVITDLLLRHGWVEKHPLYYFAATKEQVADDDELAYLSRRYLDAVVRYTDEDERRSLDAARCYVTQTTAEEIEELVTRETADSSNVAYFRRLQVRPAEGALESLSGDP